MQNTTYDENVLGDFKTVLRLEAPEQKVDLALPKRTSRGISLTLTKALSISSEYFPGHSIDALQPEGDLYLQRTVDSDRYP